MTIDIDIDINTDIDIDIEIDIDIDIGIDIDIDLVLTIAVGAFELAHVARTGLAKHRRNDVATAVASWSDVHSRFVARSVGRF